MALLYFGVKEMEQHMVDSLKIIDEIHQSISPEEMQAKINRLSHVEERKQARELLPKVMVWIKATQESLDGDHMHYFPEDPIYASLAPFDLTLDELKLFVNFYQFTPEEIMETESDDWSTKQVGYNGLVVDTLYGQGTVVRISLSPRIISHLWTIGHITTKTSNKDNSKQPQPFKSGSKFNTVKDVVFNPYTNKVGLLFMEDDSIVNRNKCIVL